jgi:uncharacterized protein (TIGR02118 family)
MARMVVVYRGPVDEEAFERHYFDIHVHLAKKLPGFRRYDESRGRSFRLAELATRSWSLRCTSTI